MVFLVLTRRLISNSAANLRLPEHYSIEQSQITDKPFILSWKGKPVGWLAKLEINENYFEQNAEFDDILHNCFKEYSHLDPKLQEVAHGHKNGWTHIVDHRIPTPARRTPNPEDIFGSVYYESGKLVPKSFEKNPAYRFISNEGLPVIPEFYTIFLQQYFEKQ